MNKATDFFVLNNNYRIPCLGFGTWQTPDGNTAVMAVKTALEQVGIEFIGSPNDAPGIRAHKTVQAQPPSKD